MSVRDDLFNRGDTAYLLLDYTVNGEEMQDGAYQELELQLNRQGKYFNVKKMLSKGEIIWKENCTYRDKEGVEQTFTGYVASLSQEETFSLRDSIVEIQLRVMIDGEVGSSKKQALDIGDVLSYEVLK